MLHFSDRISTCGCKFATEGLWVSKISVSLLNFLTIGVVLPHIMHFWMKVSLTRIRFFWTIFQLTEIWGW